MKLKHYYLVLVAILTLSCKGQTSETTQEVETTETIEKTVTLFDTEALLERVKFLSLDSLEGRQTGTKGGLIAREYVINQFKKYGIAPLLDDYTQPFTFEGRRDKKTYKGANVLGVIKGTDHPEKYIVLSAHYDHLGVRDGKVFNGADDDASGTSAIIAMAEYFKSNPPKHSVVIASFDAEEMGLQGASYFVKANTLSKEQIALNINLDMVGRNDNNELYVVGTNLYTQLQPAIDGLELPENFKLLTGHDGLDGKQSWVFSSDHGPFHREKIPFLYFGVEDHKDYHKPTDDFESIQPEFYAKAVTAVIAVFEKLDEMSS
ncbi:M28 family peptidase [Pontimicrobium aquaticum]|uniref:M28 family peptidase n=1 Tax=Pontimicrobium aquaticum TaxID=2565367 RepID=A0A4U0F194_9FLAO|nr:M28 family peptidase [Pontimicrobium aquaticum]TJY38030.1 M28 family peptidase [Pontimicrobium aquaticum]